jgi:hypothetical protein
MCPVLPSPASNEAWRVAPVMPVLKTCNLWSLSAIVSTSVAIIGTTYSRREGRLVDNLVQRVHVPAPGWKGLYIVTINAQLRNSSSEIYHHDQL